MPTGRAGATGSVAKSVVILRAFMMPSASEASAAGLDAKGAIAQLEANTEQLVRERGKSMEQTMARRESHRYFVERSNQDEKGELGWDEFQAVKYLAWEHQLALTILASWFIAKTRLDWMQRFERNPALLEQYEIDVLPLLSVSNVRELLRAAMPLPQLTTQEAAALVVKHLTNRTRSRKSRLSKQQEGSFET